MIKFSTKASVAAPLAACLWLQAIPMNAAAVEIGLPFYTTRVWGILPGAATHPLADSTTAVLLDSNNELDAVDGSLKLIERIGSNNVDIPPFSNLFDSQVRAGVADDGDVFWVSADTPNNYRTNGSYIGSAAEVRIERTFRKDAPDAELNYTFSSGTVYGFVDPEYGPGCPRGDPFCMSAGVFSTVSLRDSGDNLLWSNADNVVLNSDPFFAAPHFYRVDRLGNWTQYPWEVRIPGELLGPGVIAATALLDRPLRASIDLGGVPVGSDFQVSYHLYAYAYDRGTDLGPRRGAIAQAQDPLGGDTGVRFDWEGLTSLSRISPQPVSEPGTLCLFASLGWLLGFVARRTR